MSTEPRLSPDILSSRLEIIQEKISRAAAISGRDGSSVTLVAVTKTVSPEVINNAVRVGVRHLGENKMQEAMAKRSALLSASSPVVHHFLGHLQTNKARKAVELFDLIQSLNSFRLMETLNRLGSELNKRVRCLIEINAGNEASKTGLPVGHCKDLIQAAVSFPSVELKGFMTIAPLDVSLAETRACFRCVKELFEQNRSVFGQDPILSMGMTDDFEMAVEEGSTMVRIGRGLFGERT